MLESFTYIGGDIIYAWPPILDVIYGRPDPYSKIHIECILQIYKNKNSSMNAPLSGRHLWMPPAFHVIYGKPHT